MEVSRPMTEQQITDDVMDFTVARRPVRFKIDDDTFDAHPDLPAVTMLEFATRAGRIDTDDGDAVVQLVELFRLVLRPDSAARFVDRMSNVDTPVSMQHIDKIIPWLLERYGMRPPEPSSPSSSGSLNQVSGTSLAVTALPTASISGRFP